MSTPLTPKPLTGNDRLDERSPIGTRYTDGEDTYTLVAYNLDPYRPTDARPYLIADDDLDGPRSEFDTLNDGSIPMWVVEEIVPDGEALALAPQDEEKSARAVRAAVRRYNEPPRNSGETHWTLTFADLGTAEGVEAFHQFARAELELRKAQYALADASLERARKLDMVVYREGSQRKAAKVVGMDQSTVSRVLSELPADPA